MARDKMAFARRQRAILLQRLKKGEIVPLHYTTRVFSHLQTITRSLMSAMDFIGGTQIDARRSTLSTTSPDDVRALLRATTDFLTGDSFRFTAEESQNLVLHGNAGACRNRRPALQVNQFLIAAALLGGRAPEHVGCSCSLAPQLA
jgi:hypothetical protein